MDNLKPCPFCGQHAFVWRVYRQTNIECSKYHVDIHRIMVSGENDKEAAERWNRRADDAKDD